MKQQTANTETPDMQTPGDPVENTFPWEGADYYDCSPGPEQLSHESPEEAIESYLDGWMSPDCDVLAIIAEHSPIYVVAYFRKTVAADEPKEWAKELTDQLNDMWRDSEYGDPEGKGNDGPGDEVLSRSFEVAIREAIATRAHVWACDSMGEREFSEEQVLTMMREHHPTWFKGNK